MTLVCFAVKEEASAFQKLTRNQTNLEVLVTGIGKRNSEKAIRAVLTTRKPDLALTCGFAGGLRADLLTGDVVFDSDPAACLDAALINAGAKPAKFFCADRIATTAFEKSALRQQSGADAVEMESEVIRTICRGERIPSATVRVILDTANEDLALDFNQFLNSQQQMETAKLAWAVMKSPGKISALMRLQKQSKAAAEKLARTIETVLRSRNKR